MYGTRLRKHTIGEQRKLLIIIFFLVPFRFYKSSSYCKYCLHVIVTAVLYPLLLCFAHPANERVYFGGGFILAEIGRGKKTPDRHRDSGHGHILVRRRKTLAWCYSTWSILVYLQQGDVDGRPWPTMIVH